MSSKLHEFETLFDRVLNEIIEEEEKVLTLLQVFNDLVISLSEASSLHFNTLFARVSYITTRYKLPRPWAYALQIVRRELKQRNLSHSELLPIVLAADQFLLLILKTELDENDEPGFTAPRLPKLPEVKRAGRYKKKYARVMVTEADLSNKLLTIIDEEVACQITQHRISFQRQFV